MKEILIAVALAVVLSVAGFYTWKVLGSKAAPAAPQVAVDTRSSYATSTYSVKYPNDFILNAPYAYGAFGPKKPIYGAKFIIPGTMATGTNLSADSGVSVEQLPRAKRCTGDIYLQANVVARDIIENGTEYSFASSTGAAAGNRYEEDVYALATSSPCTAVRYFIHSAAIENFPAGTVREFDRGALLTEFDKIRASLVLVK